ncbi:PD-XK nuclease superfamily-domain-containing protein, partial [Baffinella frigidus]
VPQISDLADLDTHLPGISARIFGAVSSRECEATYQRCLKLDLESAGVQVEQEVGITLQYRGHPVGSRRCDLLLTTADGQRAIIELKAILPGKLGATHMRQLEFYMQHMGVDRGYLINFPHESNFPDVAESTVFSQLQLSGTGGVSMRTQLLRLS